LAQTNEHESAVHQTTVLNASARVRSSVGDLRRRALMKDHLPSALHQFPDRGAQTRLGPVLPRSSVEAALMAVERRGQVTAVDLGQPVSSSFNGRRQPSSGGTSRMMREYQVRKL